MAPWADVLYGTDFRWWEKYRGVPGFAGLKITQDPFIRDRPSWGVRQVTVHRSQDRLLVGTFGEIGWGGNSGFGALNLAVQFGARRIILVGFDMRLDKGVHWHGPHAPSHGLSNPTAGNVERWRRVIDEAAPLLAALGVEVVNASPVSSLQNYRKMGLDEAMHGAGVDLCRLRARRA